MSPARPWCIWRPASFPGAGLQLFLALALALGGCGGPEGESLDSELEGARALGLSRGARLYQVTLGGRGAEEHVIPARVLATAGDAVEFRTVDHRVHTLSFPSDSLSSEGLSFLESTGQRASPPLVSRGSRFILRLEGAPRGRYPFISEGHGGSAGGVVMVGEPGDPLFSGGS